MASAFVVAYGNEDCWCSMVSPRHKIHWCQCCSLRVTDFVPARVGAAGGGAGGGGAAAVAAAAAAVAAAAAALSVAAAAARGSWLLYCCWLRVFISLGLNRC